MKVWAPHSQISPHLPLVQVVIFGCLLFLSSLVVWIFVTFVCVLTVSIMSLIKFQSSISCGVWLCLNGVLCSIPSFSSTHEYFCRSHAYFLELMNIFPDIMYIFKKSQTFQHQLHSFSNILEHLNIFCNIWAPFT